MIESMIQTRDPDLAVARRANEDQYFRWLGSRGMFEELALPLSALVGPVEERSVVIPADVRGGFRTSTPSVAVVGDRRLGIMRGVNYRQGVGGVTLFAKDDPRCRTQNWWIEFDANWNPSLVKPMVDPYPERPGAVQGYEDCRLFSSAGRLWASCNFAERPQLYGDNAMGLLCEMALLRLSDSGDIEDVKALRGPWSVYHQKNWMPCPTESRPLRWVYATNPLTLVTPEMATSPRSPIWYSASAWRGGSQCLRVGDGWLWVEHRPVIGFDGPRNLYLHRFAMADLSLEHVLSVSPPFVFRNYGIEFCAGMALDGDRLVLSYSARDAMPFLALCSLERVLGSLGSVA